MTQNKSVRRVWIILAGLILGANLGHTIGVNIGSDNLPFFDALGAVIGMGIGFTVLLVIDRRTK
jgi:hypothetical protein